MLVAISEEALQVWEEGGKWETKRWEGEGDLGWARCDCHTCTSLGNGRLLLVGGRGGNGRWVPNPRLLDANNGFKAEVIQAVEYERTGHSAHFIQNCRLGKNGRQKNERSLILFGGYDSNGNSRNDVHIIDIDGEVG